jgi:hypothetical protein
MIIIKIIPGEDVTHYRVYRLSKKLTKTELAFVSLKNDKSINHSEEIRKDAGIRKNERVITI